MTFRKTGAIAILKIPGMDRAGQARRLRRAAGMLDGVLRLDINYIGDTATIEYDTEKLTLAQIEFLNHGGPLTPLRRPAADSTRGSRDTLQAEARVQGRREKGDVSSASRKRGRYGRTQRGRLGE